MKENRGMAKRLKKKDESALEELMNKYTDLVASIIYNIGRGTLSREDMEEVVTDTFVTLWKNSDKVKDETLKGYLCCIAKTKTYDKLDTVKKGIILDIDEVKAEDEFSLEGCIEQKEVNSVLGKIIKELGKPDSEIILRYYFYYQRIGRISEEMNLSSDNVKIKLHRARAKIKKLLTERGYDL